MQNGDDEHCDLLWHCVANDDLFCDGEWWIYYKQQQPSDRGVHTVQWCSIQCRWYGNIMCGVPICGIWMDGRHWQGMECGDKLL